MMRRAVIMGMMSMFCLAGLTSIEAADYVGVKKCRMCHPKQYKSWEQTKMAKAFDILKAGERAEAKTAAGLDPNKDYTADAACVGCHTTNGSAEMPGVQCEACHGAGSEYMAVMMKNRDYKREELIAKGLEVPDEATCKKCHNEKNPFHKEFVFEQRSKEGTHEHFPLKKAH